MPINVQFRITLPFIDVSSNVINWAELAETAIVFEHDADEEVNRTHIHGYFFGYQLQRKTLGENIKKTFNLGSRDFATSEKCSRKDPRPIDLSGAYCYGSEFNTREVKFAKNISPAILDSLRVYSQSKATTINIASKSAPTTQNIILKEIKVKYKPTQYEHLKTVLLRINSDESNILTISSIALRRKKIFDIVFNYFRENELFMGKYKQLDFLDMVMLKLDCYDYKYSLFQDFEKRHSRLNSQP